MMTQKEKEESIREKKSDVYLFDNGVSLASEEVW
jgi:hypothetical protein